MSVQQITKQDAIAVTNLVARKYISNIVKEKFGILNADDPDDLDDDELPDSTTKNNDKLDDLISDEVSKTYSNISQIIKKENFTEAKRTITPENDITAGGSIFSTSMRDLAESVYVQTQQQRKNPIQFEDSACIIGVLVEDMLSSNLDLIEEIVNKVAFEVNIMEDDRNLLTEFVAIRYGSENNSSISESDSCLPKSSHTVSQNQLLRVKSSIVQHSSLDDYLRKSMSSLINKAPTVDPTTGDPNDVVDAIDKSVVLSDAKTKLATEAACKMLFRQL